jgi:hypothetical protein
MENQNVYQTSELEIASYLVTKHHKLLGCAPHPNKPRLCLFTFGDDAQAELTGYYAGDEVSATELFAAFRRLRDLIQQVRSSSNISTNNMENNTNEQRRYTPRY